MRASLRYHQVLKCKKCSAIYTTDVISTQLISFLQILKIFMIAKAW